jgi:SOS-response transcriptional repressor LexA
MIYKELSEGLSEDELGDSIGVGPTVIKEILAGDIPTNPSIWNKFASYFRVDLDALRFGKSKSPTSHHELLSANPVTDTVGYRKIPLLSWNKIGRGLQRDGGRGDKRAQAMIETDVSGPNIFALRIKDDAMEPLFHKGEIIFVNPDLPVRHDQYVVAISREKGVEDAQLRQLKKLNNQFWLRALNSKYPDCPLTKRQKIVGRVVRLRMNL